MDNGRTSRGRSFTGTFPVFSSLNTCRQFIAGIFLSIQPAFGDEKVYYYGLYKVTGPFRKVDNCQVPSGMLPPASMRGLLPMFLELGRISRNSPLVMQ